MLSRHGAAKPLTVRVAALRSFRGRLLADIEHLARMLTEEMGRPLAQARSEITATGSRLDFFLSHVAGVCGDEVVLDDGGITGTIDKLT